MGVLSDEARTIWRARALVLVLARREFGARNAGTAAGAAWAFAQPLLMVAAYYLVFDVVFSMRLGEHSPTRAAGAFLIVGSIPWMAFCDAVMRGMNSLLDAGGVLQKNPLPPVLFPVRSVLASSAIFVPIIIFLTFAYGHMHHFAWPVLFMIPLLVCQLMLCMVLGYLLAILAAALRDTVQFVSFLFSVGIFLTPVLFPMSMFPEQWQWVLWLNPMTALVLGYQSVLLLGQCPPDSTWVVWGVWMLVCTLLLRTAVARSRDQLVDWL